MFEVLQVLLTYQVIIYALFFSRLDYPQHWVVQVYRGYRYVAPHILNCSTQLM